MRKLSKYEKETIINWNEAENLASVYTFNASLKRRLADFSWKYPLLCRLERSTPEGSVTYVLDKSRLSIRLVREKRLFENGILLPKDRKPEDCVDEDAYIRIIRPKLGILGLVIFLFGVFSAINDRCDPPLLEFPLIFIPWGVEAAVLIWYAVSSSRAMKDYF